MIEWLGWFAGAFSLAMYGLGSRWGFVLGCVLVASYQFAIGAWPIFYAELVWIAVAVYRARKFHDGA